VIKLGKETRLSEMLVNYLNNFQSVSWKVFIEMEAVTELY